MALDGDSGAAAPAAQLRVRWRPGPESTFFVLARRSLQLRLGYGRGHYRPRHRFGTGAFVTAPPSLSLSLSLSLPALASPHSPVSTLTASSAHFLLLTALELAYCLVATHRPGPRRACQNRSLRPSNIAALSVIDDLSASAAAAADSPPPLIASHESANCKIKINITSMPCVLSPLERCTLFGGKGSRIDIFPMSERIHTYGFGKCDQPTNRKKERKRNSFPLIQVTASDKEKLNCISADITQGQPVPVGQRSEPKGREEKGKDRKKMNPLLCLVRMPRVNEGLVLFGRTRGKHIILPVRKRTTKTHEKKEK